MKFGWKIWPKHFQTFNKISNKISNYIIISIPDFSAQNFRNVTKNSNREFVKATVHKSFNLSIFQSFNFSRDQQSR